MYNVDFVILAGYLKLFPPGLVRAYKRRIVNIHPGLLPSFGGKGYYGLKVGRQAGRQCLNLWLRVQPRVTAANGLGLATSPPHCPAFPPAGAPGGDCQRSTLLGAHRAFHR